MLARGDDAMRHPPWSPFELAARAEQGDHWRLHGRGDMHGGGIHADEEPGPACERGQLLQTEFPGEIDRPRVMNAREDVRDELAFPRVGCRADHHALAAAIQV